MVGLGSRQAGHSLGTEGTACHYRYPSRVLLLHPPLRYGFRLLTFASTLRYAPDERREDGSSGGERQERAVRPRQMK